MWSKDTRGRTLPPFAGSWPRPLRQSRRAIHRRENRSGARCNRREQSQTGKACRLCIHEVEIEKRHP